MLTIDMLAKIIYQPGESKASAKARAEKWYDAIMEAFKYADISTEQRQTMFLATMAFESAGFVHLAENLNYSAQGLANTWSSRYAKNPKATPRTPNALALKLARKPVAIANNVYANRMGNGFELSGDGWWFRGRGPGQLTGRSNFEACRDAIKVDIVKHPEYLEQPLYGALSCAWLWKRNKINEAADRGDFQSVSRIWNGGLIGFDDNDRNDKDTRMDYYIITTGVYHESLKHHERLA